MSVPAPSPPKASRKAVSVHQDSIPRELTAVDQWVVWRFVLRNEKKTKVPFNAATGKSANTKDRATWSSFTAAWEAFTNEDVSPPYDGIGFVFSNDDDFLGVDLDHVREKASGEIASWATQIIGALDSYTELSPSETGVHIIITNKEPLSHGTRFDSMGMELYSEGRYFTITGSRVPGTNPTVSGRDAAFKAVYEQQKATHTLLSSIARKIKEGDNDLRLLWAGDCSGYENDHSRADMGLCAKIAFMAQGDSDLTDRVFRHSALMRPKWDELRGEETYGAQTVRKAALSASTQTAQAGISAGQFPLTDDGNAQRLVAVCGEDLRYSTAFGWLHYTGSVWERDDTATLQAARTITQALALEALSATDKATKNRQLQWALASQSASHLNAMISLCRQDAALRIQVDSVDRDNWLLNCPNGTLNLRTGALMPHAPLDLLTKQIPVPYNPTATCPNWLGFLDRIFDHKQPLIDFIQRSCGYTLTGLVSERAFFILHGRGANGKTTFIEALSNVMGDYAGKSRIETFTKKKSDGGIPNDVAALVGLRFVYSSESEAGMKLSEGLIKELTGGDKMQARFLRQEFFTFTPKCKLWIATNHRPEIKGTDDGIWTRVKLVPFTVQIPESEQISRDVLLATFWDEAPGILAWMVRGCMEWQKTRLNAPPEVTDATQEYREESDSLGDFLDTCCEVAPNARVEMQKLYEAYSTFTATNGAHPWSMNAFGRAMTERGYPKFRSNGSPMQRKGLKLKFNL